MPIDFYQVHDLRQGEGTLSCSVSYNPAHPIFSGHFPAQPVVPGVCTMEMIKELLEAALDKSLLLRSTGQVKFLQLILPDVVPDVTIHWQPQGEGYSVVAELRSGTASAFKMNAVFELAEN